MRNQLKTPHGIWKVVDNDVGELKKNEDQAIQRRIEELDVNEEITNDRVKKARAEKESTPLPKDWVNLKNHPNELVIGNIDDGVKIRRPLIEYQSNFTYISIVEPMNNKEALEDKCWV